MAQEAGKLTRVSKIRAARALAEAKLLPTLEKATSLQLFCKEHFQYAKYEEALENLILDLKMDVITAANS